MRNVLKSAGMILALPLATVALAACGDSSSDSEAAPAASASTTATTTATTTAAQSAAGKKIVFVGDVNVPVVTSVQCGMASVAGPAGVDFDYQVPDAFDAAKQIAIVNAVVATKPDVLIVSPDDPKALVTPLKQAADQGTKVVLVAHELADDSFVSSAVTLDAYADGALAAKLLAEKVGGKDGEVALLGYTPGGSTITDARQKGFEEEIAKYPNLKYLGATVLSTIKLEDGAAAANALMSAHPKLVGLAANSEDYSIGMAQAVKQRGRADEIVTVQMDATAKAMKLLADGTLDATSTSIWYDLGVAAMKQAVAVAAGETVEKKPAPLPPFAVTPETMDSARAKKAAMAPTKPC